MVGRSRLPSELRHPGSDCVYSVPRDESVPRPGDKRGDRVGRTVGRSRLRSELRHPGSDRVYSVPRVPNGYPGSRTVTPGLERLPRDSNGCADPCRRMYAGKRRN